MVSEKNTFGSKLKNLRLQIGLTQAQLADKLNISASTIGMYEQGRREPDNSTLSKLCHELKVSGDYLLGIDHNVLNISNKEIDNVILDFIDFLETQENLIFNGTPLNNEEKNRITSALRVATAISMIECDKNSNNPNKSILLKS